MINEPALILMIGIAIGLLLSITLGILIYVYIDLGKKFRELGKEIKDLLRGK